MAEVLRRIGVSTDVLGEGPLWDVQEKSLYWVDIRKAEIRRFDWSTKNVESWSMTETVSCLAVRSAGGLVIATQTGISYWTPGSVATPIVRHGQNSEIRFNDGRCDRQGRFWSGTMNDSVRTKDGVLYRFDGIHLSAVIRNIAIPNSLCWSPDSRTMYFSDSV